MPNKDEEMVISELNLCRDDIEHALARACSALRKLRRSSFVYEQAQSYWVSHIKAAIGSPYSPYSISMKTTIEYLKKH